MTRNVEKSPISVPSEFGTAAAGLADRPSGKLNADRFPFMDLPIQCVVILYEAPSLTVAHIADAGEEPDADDGLWALLAPPAVDTLAGSVSKGNASVEFAREGSRFRDALAGEYWTPEDGDSDE